MKNSRCWLRHFFVVTLLITAGAILGDLGKAMAKVLVTDETIKTQKALTLRRTLKNGLPVIIRQIPGSEILNIMVSYRSGQKDLPPGKKSLNEWLWASVPYAGKNYPKDRVYGLTAKYDLNISCIGGIENSFCELGTTNDSIEESLPMFAALIKSPAFEEDDIKLTKERVMAKLRNLPSDPNQYVNDVVNTVFYPKGHPYRMTSDEALKELVLLNRSHLQNAYSDILNSAAMAIVVVTSLPSDKIVAELNKYFNDIPKFAPMPVPVKAPKLDPSKDYEFVDRDVPTAFIRIKMNAPSITDKDAFAAQFMYEVLSTELGQEIRTKRSLSYSVHAVTIQYSMGFGMINVSTSHPKETLEAINLVIQNFKNKVYTDDELEEYKHVFATSYYLTQETHSSLASALSRSFNYFGDANHHYDLPRELDKVTPADLSRLARAILADLRIGIIYKRSEFNDDWVKQFIASNRQSHANRKN